MSRREIRRMAGVLMARLPEVSLEEVTDPRRGPRRWRLAQLLGAVLLGAMAGCRSLRDVEVLTATLAPAVRRRLGLGRRQPDTTLRDVLCAVSVDELRGCLRRAVKAAWRRKALEPQELPFGVVALDGKCTAVPYWDDEYVQKHQPETGLPYGMARTVTCSLVSAAGRPCLDAIPIPAATNEMGHFKEGFAQVLEAYAPLFKVVTYDAGALSEENGRTVVEAGKDYLFGLKGEQRTMYKFAEELLDPSDVIEETVDVLDNTRTVTRRLVLLPVHQNWAYGNGKGSQETLWPHTRTLLRVESVETKAEAVVRREARMFTSSVRAEELTPKQWLRLVRSHWGVENSHHTLDTAFAEDDHPWIVADGNGLLAVLVLRRLAYTLLALFRSVSQRTEDARAIRWSELVRWVWLTLVAATDEHVEGLRLRKHCTVWS